MADIPLQKPSEPDIYSYGYDPSLNREIKDVSTGVVYDTSNSVNTGSVLSGGNLTLKTLSIGGLVKQVAPGDDIQAAIDAVNREGGGTVQLLAKTYTLTSDINMKSNVALVGAGIDVTILDFADSSSTLKLVGTSLVIKNNIVLKDFTVQNSLAGYSIQSQYTDFWRIENVKSNSNDTSTVGFGINNCRDFILVNCISSLNGYGFEVLGDNNRSTERYTFINCFAATNVV